MSMKKKPLEYRIRQATVIIMFFSAIVTIVTGMIMYMRGVRASEELFNVPTLHAWTGFITAGMLIIHLYLNRRPLMRYIKGLFS